MWRQITTIWRYRSFLFSLVSMDLRTRYRRSILGVGWSLMNPIMMTIVFCAVFAKWMPHADWRVFGPSFLCGMTLFEFVKSSALAGCSTFSRNESYIRQCPLPLALYNLRTVMGNAIHYLIALGVVIVCIFVLQPQTQRIVETLEILWVLIPSFIMLFIFCWSISVVASFMTVYFHDVQHLLEVFFQVFFFLTPIMYDKQMLVDRGMRWLLQINPVVTFFELMREPLTDPSVLGMIPTMWAFSKALVVTSIFFAMAIATIRALEPKLIFHL